LLAWYTYSVELSEEKFREYLAEALDGIPPPYSERLENVAFILEDEPTPEQRAQLHLYPNETLLGLYEGVPLPARQGTLKILPDKITFFKNPLLAASGSEEELKAQIAHTVWHEVAHYFGLGHDRIHELEEKNRPSSGR